MKFQIVKVTAKVRKLRILIVKLLSDCTDIKTNMQPMHNRYDRVNYQGKVKLIIL